MARIWTLEIQLILHPHRRSLLSPFGACRLNLTFNKIALYLIDHFLWNNMLLECNRKKENSWQMLFIRYHTLWKLRVIDPDHVNSIESSSGGNWINSFPSLTLSFLFTTNSSTSCDVCIYQVPCSFAVATPVQYGCNLQDLSDALAKGW